MSKSNFAIGSADSLTVDMLTCSGPGDARPTARQIVDRQGLVGKWSEKVILITGASSGIGIETARALYHTGAHLFLPVRDIKKGEEIKKDIEASTGEGRGRIDLLTLDMDSLDSVRQCAADFLGKSHQLNVLICNAGVMRTPEGTTKDGFETQFGVNHVAHFLLFQLLKGALHSSASSSFSSRVVMVSSAGHRYSPILFGDFDQKKRGYDPIIAYGQSKTANILMATEIERRYSSRFLHANAVHPGIISTNLGKHLPSISELMKNPILMKKEKSPQQGAANTVWAAVAKEWEGKGGKYLEELHVAIPHEEEKGLDGSAGVWPWAYDAEAAKRLWDETLRMLRMTESD